MERLRGSSAGRAALPFSPAKYFRAGPTELYAFNVIQRVARVCIQCFRIFGRFLNTFYSFFHHHPPPPALPSSFAFFPAIHSALYLRLVPSPLTPAPLPAVMKLRNSSICEMRFPVFRQPKRARGIVN